MESFVITTEETNDIIHSACIDTYFCANTMQNDIARQIEHCETHIPWDRPEYYNPWNRLAPPHLKVKRW